MKTSFIITAAALTVLVPASRALPPEIEREHSRAFEVVKEICDTLVPGPIVKFVEGFPPIAEPRRVVLQLAQLPPPTPAPPAGVPGGGGVAFGPGPDTMTAWAGDTAMSTARGVIGGIFGEGKSAKRPVIVGAEAKNISAIEEDLNVMLRIIDKATGGREEKTTAMAIDVFSFSGSSGPPRILSRWLRSDVSDEGEIPVARSYEGGGSSDKRSGSLRMGARSAGSLRLTPSRCAQFMA